MNARSGAHCRESCARCCGAWSGKPVDDAALEEVARLREALRGDLGEQLCGHVTGREVDALHTRTVALLDNPVVRRYRTGGGRSRAPVLTLTCRCPRRFTSVRSSANSAGDRFSSVATTWRIVAVAPWASSPLTCMTLLFVGGSLHVDGDGAGLCLPSFRLIVHFTPGAHLCGISGIH